MFRVYKFISISIFVLVVLNLPKYVVAGGIISKRVVSTTSSDVQNYVQPGTFIAIGCDSKEEVEYPPFLQNFCRWLKCALSGGFREEFTGKIRFSETTIKTLKTFKECLNMLPLASCPNVEEGKISTKTYFNLLVLHEMIGNIVSKVSDKELGNLFRFSHYLEVKPLRKILGKFILERFLRQEKFDRYTAYYASRQNLLVFLSQLNKKSFGQFQIDHIKYIKKNQGIKTVDLDPLNQILFGLSECNSSDDTDRFRVLILNNSQRRIRIAFKTTIFYDRILLGGYNSCDTGDYEYRWLKCLENVDGQEFHYRPNQLTEYLDFIEKMRKRGIYIFIL